MFQNEVNLMELLDVINSSDEVVHSYLKLHDYEYNFSRNQEQIDIKELRSYLGLVRHLNEVLESNQMAGFFLGFKLKDQADTQFDLLKPNLDTIINLEFKSDEPDKSILKQAAKHYRFLNMAYSNVIVVEYLASTDELCKYAPETGTMEAIGYSELAKIIPKGSGSIEKLANMTRADFLVSPYNEPHKFLKSVYELTGAQKNIEQEILKTEKGSFVIIGGAGSGKTLLLLDIIRKLKNKQKKIVLIMGAKPSQNQNILAKELGIELYWYYNLDTLTSLKGYDVLAFDESQRVPKKLIDEALRSDENILKIFNVDEKQVVHPTEKQRDIQGLLEHYPGVKVNKLKQSVRINQQLDSFQKRLFDQHASKATLLNYSDVRLRYFSDLHQACKYVEMIANTGVQVIEADEYIASSGAKKHAHKFRRSVNVKDVIGQEFEDILISFDEYSYYIDDGKLLNTSAEYYPYLDDKMFYEAITRASHSVEIVIIKNPELFVTVQHLLTMTRDIERKKQNELKELRRENRQLKVKLALLQDHEGSN